MKRAFSICLALTAAPPALAGEYCQLDGTELFACTFQAGKKAVELCDAVWMDGAMVSYGFFRRGGAVEKEIVTDMAGLTVTPWSGVGTTMSEAVTIHAGDGYGYELWWEAPRGTTGEETGGITVLKDGETLATLTCDPGSLHQDLATLFDKVEIARISP